MNIAGEIHVGNQGNHSWIGRSGEYIGESIYEWSGDGLSMLPWPKS